MDNSISNELKGVISKMLEPLKGLPLGIVIEGISGYKVHSHDESSNEDRNVLDTLIKVAKEVVINVNKEGIIRPRPNEVGNDIEPFVIKALNNHSFKSSIPLTCSGKKKSTGYPDIVFEDKFNRINYLECKTFNIDTVNSTMRSFYLSPSSDFKVTSDAHHYGISFQMNSSEFETGSTKKMYKIINWKILDFSKIELDVKYEFNSDNKRIYDKSVVLAESNLN